MAANLLRRRKPYEENRVSFLELFFDLVFVFAVTQLSHALAAHLDLTGAAQMALLLMAVWWVWMYTSWATNWLDPDRRPVRILLFAMMAAGLVMSAAVPKAFDEAGLVFACAYVAMQVGRTAFIVWAVRTEDVLRRNFVRILCWLCLSAVFWIGGALAEGGLRPAVWALALAIEYASPAVGFWTPGLGRSRTEDWNVEGGHMAERCGLFIIIALGESILVTGATFAGLAWTGENIAAFAVAFIGALALWWIYFGGAAEAAREKIMEADDPGRLARSAYTYTHLPIVAGIVGCAVSDEIILKHPHGHLGPAEAAAILGGPALFLAGAALFKWTVWKTVSWGRLAGLAALALLVPVVALVTPLHLAALATAVLAGVAGWEAIHHRRLDLGAEGAVTDDG